MMSSLSTSSPVSASTFAYLMRWPVFRLIWLKLIFSESDVAGYKATGQVTSERRKKPFQLARGAIQNTPNATEPGFKTNEQGWFRHPVGVFYWRPTIPSGLPKRTFSEQISGCSWKPSGPKSKICAARSNGSAKIFGACNEQESRQSL